MFRFFANLFKSNSIPVFKSFFKAYKDTTSGPRNSQQSNGKKHPIDDMFKSMLSKTSLSAPPLDMLTAMKILNIQQKQKQLDARNVLDRYYILYKKNDPANGGTAYLQSKIFSAKQTVMNTFPNAAEIQQQFYKEVVEPEQKAEQEKKKKLLQQQQKAKEASRKAAAQNQQKKQKKD